MKIIFEIEPKEVVELQKLMAENYIKMVGEIDYAKLFRQNVEMMIGLNKVFVENIFKGLENGNS